MPSLRTHGFFPHWFQREAVDTYQLTSPEQLVFYTICGQVDASGAARASQRLISDRTRLARSTVQAALDRLQSLHLIELSWPAGVKSATQYRIPEAMPLPPSTIAAPTRRDETQTRSRRTA
jgi:DNA-binding transcriptional MocR family regulator